MTLAHIACKPRWTVNSSAYGIKVYRTNLWWSVYLSPLPYKFAAGSGRWCRRDKRSHFLVRSLRSVMRGLPPPFASSRGRGMQQRTLPALRAGLGSSAQRTARGMAFVVCDRRLCRRGSCCRTPHRCLGGPSKICAWVTPAYPKKTLHFTRVDEKCQRVSQL